MAVVCLMVAACGAREGEGVDPAGSTPAAANDREPQQGIGQGWTEQDRIVHEHLHGYGWVDRSAGVVRIPIERAMDLLLAEQKSSGPEPLPTNPADIAQAQSPLERTGRDLMRRFGCTVCHDPDSVSHAPSLIGIYGQRVRLSDGTFVRADDQYLHDSIMLSSKQVVAGYEPVMPGYSSIISEPEVRELIAYLKSTSARETVSGVPASP